MILFVELAAAEAQAERPRRRRTSSRSRRRTLSGRSISDHSDMEMEPLDTDGLFSDNQSKPSGHNNHTVLNGATMEISEGGDSGGGDLEASSDQFHTQLTDFIKDKLFSRYVLSMSELNHLLNVKLSQAPPGNQLGTGVSERLCEQTVIKLGGLSLKSKVSFPFIPQQRKFGGIQELWESAYGWLISRSVCVCQSVAQ